MIASTVTADSRLRQACLLLRGTQADRLAARDLDILFQVCLSPLLLRVLSPDDSAISSRTVMNNAG